MTQPLLSLCIPTNGIAELVFPVLDSIFIQKDVPHDLYEVVVMDNGNNCSFKEKMIEYATNPELGNKVLKKSLFWK